MLNRYLIALTLLLSAHAKTRDDFNSLADSTYRKFDNTITLHMTHSPYGINWESSSLNVIVNLAMNKYLFPDTKRSLGHVTVELNCTNKNGESKRVISGQGAKSLDKLSHALLKEGVGLSLVNRPSTNPHLPLITTTGKLEDENDLTPEYDQYLKRKKDKMAFLTYKVSPKSCQDMLHFYKKYKVVTEKTRDLETPLAGNVYGFGAEPTKFQGAGCATYAEAFFEVAGLLEHFKFYQEIYATEKLIGNPDKYHHVSLGTLLLSKESISKPGKNKITLKFPDPDIMHKFVYETNKNPKNVSHLLSYGSFGNKSKYVVIDLTK